jgi:hypothetical protein
VRLRCAGLVAQERDARLAAARAEQEQMAGRLYDGRRAREEFEALQSQVEPAEASCSTSAALVLSVAAA